MKKLFLFSLIIPVLTACDMGSILNKPKDLFDEVVDHVTEYKLTPENKQIIKSKLLFENNRSEIGEFLKQRYLLSAALTFHYKEENDSFPYYESEADESLFYLLGNFLLDTNGNYKSKVRVYVDDKPQTELLRYYDDHNFYRLKNNSGVFYHCINLICKEFCYTSSGEYVGEKDLGTYEIAIIYDAVNDKTILGRQQRHYFEYSKCTEEEFVSHNGNINYEHSEDDGKCYIKGICHFCGKEEYLYQDWDIEQLTANNEFIPMNNGSFGFFDSLDVHVKKISYAGSGFKGKNFHCDEYIAISLISPFYCKETKLGLYGSSNPNRNIIYCIAGGSISFDYEKVNGESKTTYIEYISIFSGSDSLYIENKIVLDD